MSGIREAIDALVEIHEERLSEVEQMGEARLQAMRCARDVWRRRYEAALRLLSLSLDEVARRGNLAHDVEPSARLDLGGVKKGDLVDVTYGSYRTTHRVREVGYAFDCVCVHFEEPEQEKAPEEFGEDYRWSERP